MPFFIWHDSEGISESAYFYLEIVWEKGDMMYKILIIEDDLTIARMLAAHLRKWDYEVALAEDFKNIMEIFAREEPQLVLLDIGLPLFNGFHWCQQIRQLSQVPIIFLSSLDDNMNIVMAMTMGGDEFIEKPFDLNVVTAKVQAILRRTYSFGSASSVVEYHGAVLNLNDATLTYQDRRAGLTKNEFKIFQMLLENVGKIVSRDEIIERLWESDEYIDDNTLTVNVARLRKKLQELGMEQVVRTKKGIGYMVEL